MNLKQLTAFREVMLTGSVSEAARNLNRTQPAISSTIASLERDVGCRLFARRSGRLHPVPEAHYLFDEAGKILDRLTSTERVMKSIRDLDRGVLRILSMPGPSVFLLPRLIGRFVQGRDDVQVTLITRSSPQVEQLISAQQYDVGLADVGFPGAERSPLVDHEIINFDCLCALHVDDPLVEEDLITAADLHGRPMAVLYAGHPSHSQTRAAFSGMDANFNLRFETQYFLPLFTFVESGLASAVVDPLSAESYRIYRGDDQRIVFRPFRPVVQHIASILTSAHRPLSILAGAFTDELRREITRIHDVYKVDD